MPRKKMSASLRWSIFARDGFCCRYCGVQAGQEGVELEVDHVLSAAEGGDERVDNLVTACKRCNGGKSARSLKEVPAPAEVAARVQAQAERLSTIADSMRVSTQSRKAIEQELVNVKCDAYGVKSTQMPAGELTILSRLCQEFGPDKVDEWIRVAASRGVPENRCIKYVCGIARKVRRPDDMDRIPRCSSDHPCWRKIEEYTRACFKDAPTTEHLECLAGISDEAGSEDFVINTISACIMLNDLAWGDVFKRVVECYVVLSRVEV